jgi:hypothetical protein
MASWDEVRRELASRRTPQGGLDFDGVRREKYAAVERVTGRPLVSAVDFLNRQKVAACGGDVEIDLNDRDGILEVTNPLPDDHVDVLIFSPGGLPDAADSLVQIVRAKFKHTRFMSVHHAISLTFDGTGAYKIFENSRGNALLRLVQVQAIQVVPGQVPQPPRLQPPSPQPLLRRSWWRRLLRK